MDVITNQYNTTHRAYKQTLLLRYFFINMIQCIEHKNFQYDTMHRIQGIICTTISLSVKDQFLVQESISINTFLFNSLANFMHSFRKQLSFKSHKSIKALKDFHSLQTHEKPSIL